ncbi:MAG: transposase [Kiritimatiellaeota bacterium]|nr:transposase [Kiritimatiellota bacterium]
MSSITHHYNKSTGTTYVYSVESYWDKKKKAPRNRQVCIGKLDPATGAVIPTRRRRKIIERAVAAPSVSAACKVAGPYLVLESISEKHGIRELLKQCFPEDCDLISSLVYFIVQKGVALSRAEAWSAGTAHPFGDVITSQRISELLRRLTEDSRQRFMSLWLAKALEHDYLCYDITSVSSYARGNEYTKFGYNRDNDSLRQINLAMLFGRKSGLPAYYRRLPGNISDVATLKTTVKSLDFLGGAPMRFVLDRGFHSESNINELYRRRHKFTIALPGGRKWVEKIIDGHLDTIASPDNYITFDKDEAVHASTELHKWGEGNHRAYMHVFYNAERAASDFDTFTRKLIAYKNELETGKTVEQHDEFYQRYLIVKETPKRGRRILFNESEIQKYRKKYSGFFRVMSNTIKNASRALEVYRAKDIVENCFDDLKNHLDMKRLRVHDSAAMDGRLFLQFIALIYISSIRGTIKANEKLKYMTTREVMEDMETLVEIKYSGRYGEVFTERSPIQRHIMSAFGLNLST